MNRTPTLVFCLLGLFCVPSTQAQSNARQLHFDLSQIGLVGDGKQMCQDSGRLQDYRSKAMDDIVAGGPRSIPVLIGMLTDNRPVNRSEPIVCFWPREAIGDIAFITLVDLFTDFSQAKTTIPGAGWDDMLGPAGKRPASDQLHDFVKKHGRTALQVKWQRLWKEYGSRAYWDAKEKCFKLRDK